MAQRRALFGEWQHEMGSADSELRQRLRRERKEARREARRAFAEMLRASDELGPRPSFSAARTLYGDDPRWRALERQERDEAWDEVEEELAARGKALLKQREARCRRAGGARSLLGASSEPCRRPSRRRPSTSCSRGSAWPGTRRGPTSGRARASSPTRAARRPRLAERVAEPRVAPESTRRAMGYESH